jgi:hypothetical protein
MELLLLGELLAAIFVFVVAESLLADTVRDLLTQLLLGVLAEPLPFFVRKMRVASSPRSCFASVNAVRPAKTS